MQRRLAYKGSKLTIAYAREQSGRFPGEEFFNGLTELDKAKLMAIFRIFCETGRGANPEKFGTLGNGMFEFKSFQIRMPFAYAKVEQGMVLLTHGFIKKGNKVPKSEIERAWRIFKEDQGEADLVLVKKAKR